MSYLHGIADELLDKFAGTVAKKITPAASGATAAAAVIGSLTMLLLFVAFTQRKRGK